MKRVMLGAYYFPPMTGVGCMRAAKFAKYLSRIGWQVSVTSVNSHCYRQAAVDASLVADMPAVDLARLPCLRGVPLLLIKLYFPVFVCWRAWKARRELDAVVLFGSPFYPFLWVGLIQRVLGKPVVLDFRDGWSSVHAPQATSFRAGATNAIRRLIERVATSAACASVFATETLREQYVALFPANGKRFVTITNGYDPEDFTHLLEDIAGKASDSDLVVAGKFLFYTPQVGDLLMQTMTTMPDVRLRYFGEEASAFRELAARWGLEKRVKISGPVPYPKVLEAMQSARLCVLSTVGREGLGTKIFDYLALGRPVLCFVPEQSELAARFGHLSSTVFCEPPYTVDTVQNALEHALQAKGVAPEQALHGFDRLSKAQALGALLEQSVAAFGKSKP